MSQYVEVQKSANVALKSFNLNRKNIIWMIMYNDEYSVMAVEHLSDKLSTISWYWWLHKLIWVVRVINWVDVNWVGR